MGIGGFVIASDGRAAVVRLVAGPGGTLAKRCPSLHSLSPGEGKDFWANCAAACPGCHCSRRWGQDHRAGEAVERMWPPEGRQPWRVGQPMQCNSRPHFRGTLGTVKHRSPVQQDNSAVTVRTATSDRCALLRKSRVRFSHTWSPSSLPRCQRWSVS